MSVSEKTAEDQSSSRDFRLPPGDIRLFWAILLPSPGSRDEYVGHLKFEKSGPPLGGDTLLRLLLLSADDPLGGNDGGVTLEKSRHPFLGAV